MNSKFQTNITDKIKRIEDEQVRKLCDVAIREAQKNIQNARSVAIDRVNSEIAIILHF